MEKRDGVVPDSEEGGVEGPDEESLPGKDGLGVINCSAGSSSKFDITDEGEGRYDLLDGKGGHSFHGRWRQSMHYLCTGDTQRELSRSLFRSGTDGRKQRRGG